MTESANTHPEDHSPEAPVNPEDIMKGIRDSLHSIGAEKVVAESALLAGYRNQHELNGFFLSKYDPYELANYDEWLKGEDIAGVDPRDLHKRMRTGAHLTKEEHDKIMGSSCPALGIWSMENADDVEINFKNRYDMDIPTTRYWESTITGLPLIHGTSATAFIAAMEDGKFVSNRTLEEKGIDLSSDGHTGMTTSEDRQLGLNNYVFADFGRPKTNRIDNQAEVLVVFSQDAMMQPGAFITEKDILDSWTKTRDDELIMDFDRYLRGFYYPEDFLRIAAKQAEYTLKAEPDRPVHLPSHRLGMDDFLAGWDGDFGGIQANFTGWEVKMSEVSADHIRQVVVRDLETFTTLQERYGHQIPFVYVPNLNACYHGDQSERRQVFWNDITSRDAYKNKETLIDYQGRLQVINEAKPEDVHEGWFPVYMQVNDGSEPIIHAPETISGSEIKLKPGQDLYDGVKEAEVRVSDRHSREITSSPDTLFFYSAPGQWARIRYEGKNVARGVVLEVKPFQDDAPKA